MIAHRLPGARLPGVPDLMPAWMQDSGASGIRLERMRVPRPRAGEVLLRVRATALDGTDLRMMRRGPRRARAGVSTPGRQVPGSAVAGTVVAIGSGVVGSELGEEVVVGLPGGGGLAALVAVDEMRLVPRPPHLAVESAACLAGGGSRVWQALDMAGLDKRVAHRRRVLIAGASAAATIAVQLATVRGAEVWATDAVSSGRPPGVHPIAPDALAAEIPSGHLDAVVDLGSGIRLALLQRLTARGGVIVLAGEDAVPGSFRHRTAGLLLSGGRSIRIRTLAAGVHPEVVRALTLLADEGAVTPVWDGEWPFSAAPSAIHHLVAAGARAPVVVQGPDAGDAQTRVRE
ncbi:alcohol dehydrogenase catalytic domain-containing protein [Microbacterium sp.]|uniref:alcohol dehydrogenase catalytic domain-containing protein n=1 Tax=Microbacterium sp. TaxID=51671 RepID=UPI002810B510|nr:alcohol dehydrogenase catalytic domain-containing protein [Microbacterium sp.]